MQTNFGSNWTLTIFGWLPSEVPCVLNLCATVGWNRHSTFQVALESNRSSIEVKPSSKQSGEDKPFEAAHDQWSMINDSIFIAPSLSYICWTALKINFRSSQEITILINDLKLPTDHRSMSQMINASIFTAMLSSPCRKGQFKELVTLCKDKPLIKTESQRIKLPERLGAIKLLINWEFLELGLSHV